MKSREMAKGLYYNRPTANRRASRRRRHAAVGDGGWAVTLRLARLLGWEGGERRTDAGNEHRRTPRGTPQDAPHHTRPKKASDTLQVSRHLYTLVRNMFGMPARAQARYARSRPSVATLLLVRISLMHRGRAPLAYHGGPGALPVGAPAMDGAARLEQFDGLDEPAQVSRCSGSSSSRGFRRAADGGERRSRCGMRRRGRSQQTYCC